jgi:hypothetical protein
MQALPAWICVMDSTPASSGLAGDDGLPAFAQFRATMIGSTLCAAGSM